MIGYGNSMFLATHGILARSASGGVDPDAQAFITAASITDPTQQSAINTLVTDLKGYGVWTKMKALYPFVGGTSTSTSYNLRNTAQFQISWIGGWTWNNNGVTGNGLNTKADTNLNGTISLSLNSNSIGFYSRTNNTGNIVDCGTLDYAMYNYAGNLYYNLNSGTAVNTGASRSDGFFTATRRASNEQEIYRNGVSLNTNSNLSSFFNNVNIYFGDWNTGAPYPSNRNYAFAFIGDALSDTEAANFYTAVQAFQVTLGRSIGTQTVSDADAQAFVTNAGIVDQVEANAINNLVIGLKADGLWTKASMIHPYVGGTSTSTSYNLKNTAQFQISWVGGWTWASQGVKGNGTNSYGNTGFNFSTEISSVNNFTVALYTNQYIAGGVDFGADNNSNWYLAVKSSTFGTNVGAFAAAALVTYADTTGLGFYTAVKSTNPTPGFSNNVIYKNGSSVLSTTNTSGTLYNGNVYIGGLNRNGSLLLPTNIRYAFSAIFNASLTPTEATNLNTRVTTFQTTLNRL